VADLGDRDASLDHDRDPAASRDRHLGVPIEVPCEPGVEPRTVERDHATAVRREGGDADPRDPRAPGLAGPPSSSDAAAAGAGSTAASAAAGPCAPASAAEFPPQAASANASAAIALAPTILRPVIAMPMRPSTTEAYFLGSVSGRAA